MTLKNDWAVGNTYTHTDQNDVANQVNTNTTAINANLATVTGRAVAFALALG